VSSRLFPALALPLILLTTGKAQNAPKPCESSALVGAQYFPQVSSQGKLSDAGDSISWRTLPSNIWHDQANIYWTCPRKLVREGQWLPIAAFLGATAASVATDQYAAPYFRQTNNFHGFNTALSGTTTSVMIATVPAATYLVGLIKKDAYAQRTALWTGEALADSLITAEVLKLVTRRARPEAIAPDGNFGDTWVDSRAVTDGGFPSGHTIAAFSVATVMSRRYGRSHRWVPFVAYGAAATIGLSRVTLSAHNVSDVLVGATLGYAISRFVVLGRLSPQ
jgi:membrane-associated phospholipid phosphatase